MKKALIFGILGQDGSFMAELLHSKGYEVTGVMRQDADAHKVVWIQQLLPSLVLHSTDITNFYELSHVISKYDPDEIYNFAAISNVRNPFGQMQDVLELNAMVPELILHVIKLIKPSAKFFQASSCLIWGRDTSGMQNEKTPYAPLYPYGIAKLYAQNMVKEYRETFGMFACSGIFFPHESERRPEIFLSRKVSKAIARIKNGSDEKIHVGSLLANRNYGYAPDYIEAAWLMMQQDEADDYVIGSNSNFSVKSLVACMFQTVGLNYNHHVIIDQSNRRNGDNNDLKPDYSKIKAIGWKPKHDLYQIAKKMVEHDMKQLSELPKSRDKL